MTIADSRVAAGSSIHELSHPKTWHVIQGELGVTIGGETWVAGPGCAAVVPLNKCHTVPERTAS